jgi:hypothetical protein
VKTTKGEGVAVCSLVCNISKVEDFVGAPRWGLGQMTSKLIIHTNLHKINKKLVNV